MDWWGYKLVVPECILLLDRGDACYFQYQVWLNNFFKQL